MKDVHECMSCEKGILQKPFLYTRHISCHVLIFGGILRCDVAAKGIIEGFKLNQKSVPMVVVLRGTNSEEAKEILKSSDMEIYFSDDLPSAAKEINKRLGR